MSSHHKIQLSENYDKLDKANYLKASIGFFIALASVDYFMFMEFKESGGVEYLFVSVEKGAYYPLLLVVMSIVLLALLISNLTFYLKYDITKV